MANSLVEEQYPLISICIPTYNGERFIEETLKTALTQSYTNLEIIITDDSSTDNTLNICKAYAKKDSRIRVYKNTSNLGLLNNWCESIEKATSNWIKFLFQDDLLEKDCIKRMISAALKHNVEFVVCNRTYFFEEEFDPKIKRFYTEKLAKTEDIFTTERKYNPEESSKLIAPYIFNNCMGEPPTLLFNKKAYQREQFPDHYKQIIDYLFILNNVLVKPFVFIPEKLVRFRVHNSSESMRNNEVNKNNREAFYNFLYVQFYERIQLCYDILNNPVFKKIRGHISKSEVMAIKNLYVLYSYKRHGFENVYPFYEQSNLAHFVLDRSTSSYSYWRYKWFKLRYKKIKKKYNV